MFQDQAGKAWAYATPGLIHGPRGRAGSPARLPRSKNTQHIPKVATNGKLSVGRHHAKQMLSRTVQNESYDRGQRAHRTQLRQQLSRPIPKRWVPLEEWWSVQMPQSERRAGACCPTAADIRAEPCGSPAPATSTYTLETPLDD